MGYHPENVLRTIGGQIKELKDIEFLNLVWDTGLRVADYKVNNMYSGSCLCGAVQFEIKGPISHIVHCHCSQCRKVQGSAFATNGIVKSCEFKILSGEDKLTAYESTRGQTKYFCQICGSPIISKTESKPDQVRIRLGTIVSDIKERPMAHIFTTSKANWEEITGALPQYESYEPGRS